MADIVKQINKLLGIKDSYQAPARMMEIIMSDDREKYFMAFLKAFDYEVNYDWFHEYFQKEHAERKDKKQDFTPQSISKLMSKIVGNHGSNYYEPAAGTGGIIIERWHEDRMQTNPFDYQPCDYYYEAEELSDRTIPFLLFNMIIRGMNGTVVQCDVLTREAYGAWFIQNDKNDHMLFSSLNRLPYSEWTEKELNIKFVEQNYPEVKQTKGFPKWLAENLQTQLNNVSNQTHEDVV
ncbi:SAM-dependent methyltransferase [Staphylococcus simulans]|uniref:SAM-dependent methyltransferase n=1 Tax=Staphylococcus simulans TaxID=1286 RepID=UPI0021D3F362|nr:SAM-dependent methyltransferase [Staphylococcus simulans]UXR32327.1 SAM-dependent methyltransferase [Staphylococcus simulans]